MTRNPGPVSAAAIRMRKMRERRRCRRARIVSVEVTSADIANLLEKGFIIGDEPSVKVHLSKALQRLLRSIE